MPWTTDEARDTMLDALAVVGVFCSLHSAYPDDTGSNELTGGTPPYTREAITWNPASSGQLDNNLNPTFDVPAGSTVGRRFCPFPSRSRVRGGRGARVDALGSRGRW